MVPPVVADGHGGLEPLHPCYQVRLRRFDHQVVLIAHQQPRMHPPSRAGTDIAQRAQEPLTIGVVSEDRLPPVTTIQNVIERSFELNSGTPRDSLSSISDPRLCKRTFLRSVQWRQSFIPLGYRPRNALNCRSGVANSGSEIPLSSA
jgi:hypothetical protein